MNYLVVALLLAVLVCAHASQNLNILKVERTVSLGGFYAIENVKINFVALEDTSHFNHAVAAEYDVFVFKILFRRTAKEEKKQFGYTKGSQIVNGVPMVVYKVNLGQNYRADDEGEVHISISYLNRFVNLPKSITLTEEQKLQYEDYKYFVTPYAVKEQENTFKFQKILDYDTDGEKKGINGACFNNSRSPGYNLTKTTIFGVNHNPLVQFTKVVKTIDVSHWGEIALTEEYSIKNVGPQLKGQFSRVTFGSPNAGNAKTAFKSVEFELPYSVHGLYYRDEVGNISTSRAYRDEKAKVVRVGLAPRFGILGGWKSNWEIGYNINTDEVLYHENFNFELRNLKLDYAIDKILSEDYTVKLVLPEGAHSVSIEINKEAIDMSLISREVTSGYLDFHGRPTYVLENMKGLRGQSVNVVYELGMYSLFKKPLILSGLVLLLLLSWIVLGRLNLEVFNSKRD